MNKIKVLDSSVFNKIAAGEVVEKPASVVKELVENAIDAGANAINIEIYSGGIEKIRVSDNGCGIYPEDIKTAFLPHATSKIFSVENLSNIQTLGFRGEALASIASVSKVCLQSKVKENEFGKKIEVFGGEFQTLTDIGMTNGTIIEISELFYNIPARKKFLRKSKTEESEITNLISRYILSNPTIKFNYYVDDSIVYSSTGKNLEEAIYVVYKKDFLNNLIEVNYEKDNVKISGYISKPTFSKANRTYQTLIINGRYVVNSLISTAVQNCYENYLMKGQFPVYILNFELPYDSLDVNVHPNKLDVKFENTQQIYGLFYSAISLSLNSFSQPKQVVKTSDDVPFSYNERQDILKSYSNLSSVKSGNSFSLNDSGILGKVLERKINETTLKPTETPIKPIENATFESTVQSTMQQVQKSVQERFVFEDNYKVIGTCFKTYIFLELNEKLYILDQHACHERLNFDKLTEQVKNKSVSVQTMLLPELVNVNNLEYNFINNNIESFKELGFIIEPFGNDCFKVSGYPYILKGINVNEFFNKVLSNLTALKNLTSEQILRQNLATMACKASVKAGDDLMENDIKLLISKMKENNMTLQCPHGRPAVLEITKTELEKWFKRKL